MPAFSLPFPPFRLPAETSQVDGTLPYRWINPSRGFGGMLEPRYIFGAGSLDQ